MPPNSSAEADVEGWLKTLGIESLCQWDLLVFLYRHPTSLVGAEDLARLLGYAPGAVSAALEVLESLGLVKRSRPSQGVRLYQFTVPSEPPRSEALGRLLALAGHPRVGRLRVAKQLRQGKRPTEKGPQVVSPPREQPEHIAREATEGSLERTRR